LPRFLLYVVVFWMTTCGEVCAYQHHSRHLQVHAKKKFSTFLSRVGRAPPYNTAPHAFFPNFFVYNKLSLVNPFSPAPSQQLSHYTWRQNNTNYTRVFASSLQVPCDESFEPVARQHTALRHATFAKAAAAATCKSPVHL
jgi:hypothetical protein